MYLQKLQPIASGVYHWADLPVKKITNGKVEKMPAMLLISLTAILHLSGDKGMFVKTKALSLFHPNRK